MVSGEMSSEYGKANVKRGKANSSAVLANEAARKDQEVGWRVTAGLAVRAAACADNEALLHFELRQPTLQLRGAARHAEWFPRPSLWDAHKTSSFYAHWRTGEVVRAYLDPADPPAIAGYKRALISLFQFQILDGERNETDVSGECSVLHETLGEFDFRKIKRACRWQSTDDATSGAVSRRLTRYTLRPALDALSAVHAEELHVLHAAGVHADYDAAVKVRAWTRLTLEGEEKSPKCSSSEPGLRADIDALPTNLRETTLPLTIEEVAADADEKPLSLADALELAGNLSAAAAGAGGDVPTARTVMRVLPALSKHTAEQLVQQLQAVKDKERLAGMAMALGALASPAAHDAAAAVLQLRAFPLQPAADAYLSAVSTARAPSERAVRALLAVADKTKYLTTGALLAAAAAAPRVSETLALHVKDELAKQLARCKDDPCRSVRLAALGNLRRADTVELLVEHACKGTQDVALAALTALDSAPEQAVVWSARRGCCRSPPTPASR
ncbi:hypothetical protein NE865_14991 [Phthorimaea operculella]|nr:hypothetical protein NE865_14991 [Phthorimaea operculella]